MHNKIKEIRMRMELSEAQISSLLNISSYKYRRFENGSLDFTTDVLLLLSIMYDISIDSLIFDKICVDDIFKANPIKKTLELSKNEKISFMEANMCRYCTFSCGTINYRVVKNILTRFLHEFAKNLYNIRCLKAVETTEISSLLQSDVKHYSALENGKIWPTVYELISISSFSLKSVNEMFGLKNETDK